MKRSAVITTINHTAMLPIKLTVKNIPWQWSAEIADGTKLNRTQYWNKK